MTRLPMSRLTRQMARHLAVVTLTVLFVLALASCGGANEGSDDARHTVMTWCRLAECPANRTDEKIEVNGSAMTREFVVTFQAKPADLAQWIAASSGLKEATLGTDGDVTLYTIAPQDAAYCFARINHVTGAVYLKTYWS